MSQTSTTEHAGQWTGIEIARWFQAAHLRHLGAVQGCEGLALPDTHGGYVWLSAFVDLDYQWGVLLDVRTVSERDDEEYRDWLRVYGGPGDAIEVEWRNAPVLWRADSADRLLDGLRWFADGMVGYHQPDD